MAVLQPSVPNFGVNSTYNIGADPVAYLASNPTAGTVTKRYSWSVPAGSSLVSAILTSTTSGDGGTKKIGGVTRADWMDFTAAVQSVWGNGYIDLAYYFVCIANVALPAGPRTETSYFNNNVLTITYNTPTAATLSNVKLDNSASNIYKAANGAATLSWDAANGTNNVITSYSIYYRDNGGAWGLYASGVTAKSYTVYGHPTAGNNRQFYVVALAPYGNSGTVTSPTMYAYSAVGTSTGVGISPSTVFPDKSVTLSWTAPSGGVGTTVTGYQILRNDVVITTVTGTSHTFSSPAVGSYTYKVVAVASVSGYNSAKSAGVALTVAPPASDFTLDKSTVTMDGVATIKATITPINAAYNHDVTFELDATRKSTANVPAQSNPAARTFTVPLAWCVGVKTATSATAKCTVVTKSGSTVIGQLEKTFTVIVPASVKPTVVLAVEPVSGFNGLYLKGKSKCKLTATATMAQESPILSYALTGGGYSGSSTPFTTGVLNTIGVNAMSVTAKDSRQRTSDAAVQNITVLDYANPVISAVSAFRSDAAGNPLESGEHVAVKASLAVSPVTGNSGTATVRKRITGGTWETAVPLTHNTTKVLSGALQANAYEIEITLTDTVTTVSTYTTNIRPAQFMFDFRMDRAGIGKLADTSKKLVLPDDWTTNINADQLDGYHASDLLLLMYPIGAIYISTVSTSPATLFGGTWAAIGAGTFLVAAGTGYAAGATGGASTHTHTTPNHAHTTPAVALTVAQLASHTHPAPHARYGSITAGGSHLMAVSYTGTHSGLDTYATGSGATHAHGNTGNAAPTTNSSSNLPPYYAVYMWRRTA